MATNLREGNFQTVENATGIQSTIFTKKALISQIVMKQDMWRVMIAYVVKEHNIFFSNHNQYEREDK